MVLFHSPKDTSHKSKINYVGSKNVLKVIDRQASKEFRNFDKVEVWMKRKVELKWTYEKFFLDLHFRERPQKLNQTLNILRDDNKICVQIRHLVYQVRSKPKTEIENFNYSETTYYTISAAVCSRNLPH